MIPRRASAALLVTASLLFAACGGDDDSDSGAPPTETAASADDTASDDTASEDTASEDTAADDTASDDTAADDTAADSADASDDGSDAPAQGGEVTILRANDIDGWDPDGARLVTTYVTLPNVLEGLVRVGTDGVTIEPALAESWTVDADAATITFTLREGATFSDGTPVTADDVVFSITEWGAGPRLGVFFSDITGATADDERTVTMTMSRPSTFVLDFLASGIAPVVPKDYAGLTREEFYQAPIGAGPFVVDTFTPGVETVLVRNERYHTAGVPALDKVTYKIVSDASQQLAQFESGEADIIESIDASLAQQVDESQRLTVNPMSRILDVVFNHATPLGQDLQFRQAVNHAINRDQLIEIAYEGLASPAEGIMPPGTIGSVGCDCDTWTYDPEAAQAALEASSYAGEELRFVTQASGGDSPQIELIRADLEAIGINMTVEELDIQVLLERVASGEYDFGVGTYNNVSPTAGDVMFYMYVTNFFSSGAPVDQVLTTFNEFAVAADADAKGAAVRGLETWAAETLPIVPVLSPAIVVPVSERVQGLTVRPYNRYYLDELSVG